MRSGAYGNTYEEVREVGRGQRGSSGESGPLGKLCGSLCCSCFGVALFISSLGLVAHNEMSSVCVQRALQSAREAYEEIDCSPRGSESSKQPIHLSCPIAETSMATRTPGDFGMQWLQGAFSEKAVKVRQEVEMLQCVENKRTERRKEGDRTVEVDSWTYSLEWKKSLVNSNDFKAWNVAAARDALQRGCGRDFVRNPSSFEGVFSKTLEPSSLMVGDFDLTRFLGKISASEPVTLQSGRYYPPVSQNSGGGSERRVAKDGSAYTWQEFVEYYGQERGSDEWRSAQPAASGGGSSLASVQGNTVHTCSGQEGVGCMRLSFYKSSATYASHIGKHSGSASGFHKTRAWTAPSSWMCSSGKSSQVDLFTVGTMTAEDLVESAESDNMAYTWLLRVVGLILPVVGIMMFLQPLQTVANLVDEFFNWFTFIPIVGWLLDTLGDAVAGAVGCAIFCVAAGIGLPSGMLVLSLSWCIMRPLLGIPMALACLGAMGLALKSLLKMAEHGKGKRKTA